MTLRPLALPALLAALLLWGGPAGAGEEEIPPAPVRPAEAPAAETDDQILERITSEMMAKIEVIRGLSFKKDVERVWKSRDEARAEMLEELEKEAEKEDLDAATRAMVFFGFLKEGADLKAIFSDFLASAVAGYYIPEKKVFSLVRGFNEDMSRPVVFHELVHAVEDQYFDYQERTEKYMEEDLSDHAMALKAIVEGSARMWENRFVDSEPGLRARYMQEQMKESVKQMAALLKAPPSLIIMMALYPYENGSLFLDHVLPAMGKAEEGLTEQDALARVFGAPPTSTEQVLHPEKYLGCDLPRGVRLGDASAAVGEGWEEILNDTMGELGTGLALNAYLHPNVPMMQIAAVIQPPGQAVTFKGETGKAVAGWDGDRYAVYEKDGALCMGWTSAWDSEEDAAEFAATYGKVLGKKYKVPVAKKGADGPADPRSAVAMDMDGWTGTRVPDTDGGASAVLRRGEVVIVAERVPADRLEAVLGALAGAEIVRDPKDTLPKPR